MTERSAAPAQQFWLVFAIWFAMAGAAGAAGYRFAVDAPDVPSVRIWVQAVSQSDIAPIADKKVAKRTTIDGKSYFVLPISADLALMANRLCADVPAGWLVRWHDGYVGDDGAPQRTLCTPVGPLVWTDGVTTLTLETASEASIIAEGLGFQYDIGKGVPPKEVTLIKTAFWIAQSYLNRFYGGAISKDYAPKVIVKIVADGHGDGCCSGLAESGARPFFDVRHPYWAQNVSGRGWTQDTDKMKSAIDEYVHGWHASLGALSLHDQPLGNWMNSGIAEFIAYSALVEAGKIQQKDADRMEFTAAVSSKELDPTLLSLQQVVTPVWPGHVGYVAIKWLVASSPNGLMSLRLLATAIGDDHKSVDEAFFEAFGITFADFYPQFEAWKKAIKRNPVKAAQNMPKLVLSTAPPPAKSAAPSVPAELTADQLFRKGYDADTGSNGTSKDAAEAVKWYTLAAAKGQHEAERNLAGLYGSGRGVAQNDAEARRLFTLAAEGGDAQAQYALGEWYSEGRDFSIKWFRLAAKQGHADALAELKKLGVTLD